MKEKIFIATFSQDAVAVIKEHGLNIEINHTCISEDLDPARRPHLLSAINADLLASGVTGSSVTGSGITGSGVTDSGVTGSGITDSGITGSGVTDSGVTGSGITGSGVTGSSITDSGERIIVHGPFTEIYPAAIDYRARQFGRQRLDEAFQVCQAIGAKVMVVHSGYIPFIYFKGWQAEKSALFWQDYMKDKPEDFFIYVENVLEDEPYMLADMMKKIDDPRIRLCLDVGHAAAAGGNTLPIETWIRVLDPYLAHFHLHNNYGDRDSHGAFDDGTMDFHRIFKTIENCCGKDVTFTIESQDCAGSVRWLLENGYI